MVTRRKQFVCRCYANKQQRWRHSAHRCSIAHFLHSAMMIPSFRLFGVALFDPLLSIGWCWPFLYADKNETEINVNATIGGFLKLVFTIIRLVLITIFVSLFLYPLIHETGHWIAAKTLNLRVIEFEVFPSPHISFDFADTQSGDLVWLSLGSCVIPQRSRQ